MMERAKGRKARASAGDGRADVPPVVLRLARGLGFATMGSLDGDRFEVRGVSAWEIARTLGEAYRAGHDEARAMEARRRRR